MEGFLYGSDGDEWCLEIQRQTKEWEASYWGQIEAYVALEKRPLEDFVALFDPTKANELVHYRSYSASYKQTPLMFAARFNRPDICQYLLSVDEVDPNAQNENGETALVQAFMYSMLNANYTLNTTLLRIFINDPRVNLNLGPKPQAATADNGWSRHVGLKPTSMAFEARSRTRNGFYGDDVLFMMILTGKHIDLEETTLIPGETNNTADEVVTVKEWFSRFKGLPSLYATRPKEVAELCVEFSKVTDMDSGRAAYGLTNFLHACGL